MGQRNDFVRRLANCTDQLKHDLKGCRIVSLCDQPHLRQDCVCPRATKGGCILWIVACVLHLIFMNAQTSL